MVKVQRRFYKKPPVQEIVCDFRFRSAPMPLTILAQFLEVFEDYPTLVEHFDLKFGSLELDEAGLSRKEDQLRRVVRLQNSDESSLIQLSEGMLAYNQIGTHQGWEHYRKKLLLVLHDYREVVQPEGLHRLTLRYLDRIDIPGYGHKPKDFFLLAPDLPDGIASATYFSQTLEIPTIDNEALRITIRQLKPNASEIGLSVMMDLHYFIQHDLNTDDELNAALERAHEAIWQHFELSITPKTRQLFEEVFE